MDGVEIKMKKTKAPVQEVPGREGWALLHVGDDPKRCGGSGILSAPG